MPLRRESASTTFISARWSLIGKLPLGSICAVGCGVASKKTLNAKNLEALGAKRLAELLIEISMGNAAAKRRLRLELAGAQSPAEVAREIRKRLTTIARSRSFVDWQNRRALVDDLEAQRRAIVDHVAKADPAEALDLMWRFMGLAGSILERCDDSSGAIIGIFHLAASDLGDIAKAAKVYPKALADQAFHALIGNDYGQYGYLISVLTPALGSEASAGRSAGDRLRFRRSDLR